MNTPRPSLSPAQQKFLSDLQRLWPLAKGSLTEVRKPCIRKSCPACARGDKHPAFLFTYQDGARKRCLYVPRALAPDLRRAIANGRKVQNQLTRLGVEWIREQRAHSR